MTNISVERMALLLLVAALVSMVARRFRMPYTVGLVLTGAGLAFSPFAPSVFLTKDLIFSLLLPPLIFEASLAIPWTELWKILSVVSLFATIGLLFSAFLTGAGMHYLLGWPLLPSGIFGVLIAATDPVSVIASFREMKVAGRLRTLVEAESLFNDGTAAVVFGLLLAFTRGGTSPSVFGTAMDAARVVGGGIGCGCAVALAILYLAGKTRDHLVELSFTTVAAYGSFLLAEHLRFSGVLSTLAAGLIIGNRGHLGAISEKGRENVDAFWGFAAFVANSLIFLLIGMEEARQDFSHLVVPSMAAIGLTLASRAASIYPISFLFSSTSSRISRAHQHVLVWGGLRGALALALALGLPTSVPLRSEIIGITFAVVAFSILVQGLTMAPLLRRLGLFPPSEGRVSEEAE